MQTKKTLGSSQIANNNCRKWTKIRSNQQNCDHSNNNINISKLCSWLFQLISRSNELKLNASLLRLSSTTVLYNLIGCWVLPPISLCRCCWCCCCCCDYQIHFCFVESIVDLDRPNLLETLCISTPLLLLLLLFLRPKMETVNSRRYVFTLGSVASNHKSKISDDLF